MINDADDDDKDNEKLNFVAEISGEDDDEDGGGSDSESLEEQELRLIALKSAVVKKHLARKSDVKVMIKDHIRHRITSLEYVIMILIVI